MSKHLDFVVWGLLVSISMYIGYVPLNKNQ